MCRRGAAAFAVGRAALGAHRLQPPGLGVAREGEKSPFFI